MKKFNTGFFLGGLLGAGATWLNATKKGKKTRDQIIEHAVIVYSNIKKEILATDSWKELSKNEYIQKVEECVQKYAIETGLSEKTKKILEKLVISQWKRFRTEVKKDTTKKDIKVTKKED